MDFIQMIQRLQLIYEYQLVMISCGAFYIAIVEDAIMLNELLGLKTTCAKNGICKVGVPKNSIEKYIDELDENLCGYVILEYDKNKREIIKKYEKNGKPKKINDFNKGCKTCEFYGKYKETEYEEVLNKYFKKEFGENAIW